MADVLTDKILAILARVKRISPDSISLDTQLQDLGLDSLDTIVLLSELEDEFRITIPDDRAARIRTVRDVVEGVKMLSSNASPAPAD